MASNIEEHPNPNRRWRNRRRMAWIAILSGICYPLLTWVTDSPTLADIAGPYYMFVGMVVGVYIGAAAWETINGNR